MATPLSNEISFNTFYLTEFFNHTFVEAQDKIADTHLRMLKGLSKYLLKEEKIIDGLEMVARYHTTNDLAIFLFDMIERANDYGPKVVYNSLNDLATDFVNLYSLMMEDEQSVASLKKIIAIFQEKYGDLEKEKHFEEFLEMAQTENIKTDIGAEVDLPTYFKSELYLRLANDKGADFLEPFFSSIEKDADDKQITPALLPLFSRLKELYPERLNSLVAGKTYLDELADTLRTEIQGIKKSAPDVFKMVLNKKDITPAPEEDVDTVEKTEPSSSLDILLVDYFRSEVDDWVEDVHKILTQPLKTILTSAQQKEIVTAFKSLKELSMIHGYSGLEHVAHLIIKELDKLGTSSFSFSESSVTLLDEIINTFKDVGKFAEKSKSGERVEALKEKIEQLRQSYTEPYKIEEVEEKPEVIPEAVQTIVEEEVSPAIPEVELFDINDKRFGPALKDVLKTIAGKATACHASFLTEQSEQTLRQMIAILRQNAFLFPDGFEPGVVSGLQAKYASLRTMEKKLQSQALHALSVVWEKIAETPCSDLDVKTVTAAIAEIILPEDAIDVHNPQVAEALAHIIAQRKKLLGDGFENAFYAEKPAENTKDFLNYVGQELKLIGADGYEKLIEYYLEQIELSRENAYLPEVVAEFSNAFMLFTERLQHQGINGDCSDIIHAIDDLVPLEPEQPLTESEDTGTTDSIMENAEPAVEETSVDESMEEDEDVLLFREEGGVNILKMKESLNAFKDGRDRSNLHPIENAAHSVRSAAHLLNFENAAKLSASIEETAEVFGQSELELPEDMTAYLEQAIGRLEELLENPESDSGTAIENLERLLDQIAIEDSGSSPEKDEQVPQYISPIETPSDLSDEQLFTSDSDEDDELREIFKEESVNFLNDIQDANTILRDDPQNVQAVEKLGYAAHSLRSAAKMLGFIEISQITDSLEKLTEALNDEKIKYTSDLFLKIEEAHRILALLGNGKEIDSTDVSRLIDSLEESHWEKEEQPYEQDTVEKMPENMREIFVEEARELIDGLNDDFLELENLPESEMILANALRRLHTLKGSAYISSFNNIGDLAHKMEDFFQLYKTSSSDVKSEMLDSAFVALDLIADIVNHVHLSGSDAIDQMTSRLAAIDNKLFSFQSFSVPEPGHVPEEKPVSSAKKQAAPARAEEKNILKIDTEYMDKMVDMASELMINQTQLGANLHALKEILANIEGEKKQIRAAENILEDSMSHVDEGQDVEKDTAPQEGVRKISENIKDVVHAVNLISSDLNRLTENFDQNIGRLTNISKLLHSDMLKTRMVPIDNLFNRYPRAVRDLAKKQGKKVNLIIEDNNTEMDRAMVEGLAEPILHVIRNAIDHGIETVEERKALDKPENGTLVLRARQERNQILIDIEDDGAGIDVAKVKEQILKQNLVDSEHLKKMSEAEVLDYIFYPAFTTRSKVTEESGRGIGLDAVASQLQKLKGNVRLKTEKGVGTSFMLRVPLTLVVSHALMATVANQTIAMPVFAVQEIIQFKRDEIIEDDGKKYIRVRGRLLPYVHLLDILQFNRDVQSREETIEQSAVVIFDAGVSISIGIDAIVGRQEVVIKSLGSHLQNVEYIAGGTIMANGEVALILDFARVIKKVENQYFGNVPEKKTPVKKVQRAEKPKKSTAKKAPLKKQDIKAADTAPKQKVVKNRQAKIMIVDDSNSVRNFVGSILERNNFVTVKAVNGADALEKLESERVDLIITDLEMPKMHGFDLISHIREQNRYAQLPIIILTGRAGMKHRTTGEELGANAFIVKPFKENDLLSSISEFIKTT